MAVSILEEEVKLEVEAKLSKLPPLGRTGVASDLVGGMSEHGPVIIPHFDENGLELLLGELYINLKLEDGWDRTLVAGVNSVRLNISSAPPLDIQRQYHFYATITRLYQFQVPLEGKTIIDDFYILTTFNRDGIDAKNVERIATKESNLLREPFPLCPLTNAEHQELKILLTSHNEQRVQHGFQKAFYILGAKLNYELPPDQQK